MSRKLLGSVSMMRHVALPPGLVEQSGLYHRCVPVKSLSAPDRLQICSPLGCEQYENVVGEVTVPLNVPDPVASTRTCPPWKFQVPSTSSAADAGAAIVAVRTRVNKMR